MERPESGKNPGRTSSWLELELTVTIIKPVTVRSNLNYYTLLDPVSYYRASAEQRLTFHEQLETG
jgi:hypothetical protein